MAAAREEKRRAVVRRRAAVGREKRFEGILKEREGWMCEER
jgi:hypothetical protein